MGPASHDLLNQIAVDFERLALTLERAIAILPAQGAEQRLGAMQRARDAAWKGAEKARRRT